MSGIFNLVLASFGSAASPVGLLAVISNPNGNAVSAPNMAIRNDQLNASVQTSASGFQQLTALGIPLTLDSITWQTALTDGTDFQGASGIAIDSAGNPVIAGSKLITSSSFNTGYVVKFNNSGVVQWQTRINNNSDFFGLTIDSSDNIYCAGAARFFATSRTDIYVVKFNSSGTVQLRRTIGDTGTPFESASSVSINNADYFNVAATSDAPGNVDSAFLILDRSTGATIGATTQRDAGGSGRQEGAYVLRGEADTVSYFLVNTYATLSAGSRSSQVLLRHTNATGFPYQRQLSSTTSIYAVAAAMSPGNTYVYTCARLVSSDGLREELLIAKYSADTSGTLVWQRKLACPAATITAKSIAVDSLDNVYVTLSQVSSGLSDRVLILKVPGSGAGAGNSVVIDSRTYTYSASTVTASSGGLLVSSYSPSNIQHTEGVVTPTAASAANTLTIADQTL
jgi:hypothetical protein